MSGKLFECGYGAILAEDVEVLEACLQAIIDENYREARTSVSVVEIGMHDGGTAKGMERFVREKGWDFFYVGIDPDDGTTRPRYVPKGGEVIVGDSAEVFHKLGNRTINMVWVDGCHCFGHIVLDTLHYAPKVRIGGFMCYHDVNPRGQFRTETGYQYHGPKDDPHFGIAVDVALASIGWPFAGWEQFMEWIPSEPDRLDCGTRAYRRVR